MKKILIFLLLGVIVYLAVSFYFMDREFFLCPIEYKNQIIIRNDSRGDGFFAASRHGRRTHEGIDLLAEVGVPVLAARSGTVTQATANRGMGKYVVIRHRAGIKTIYGHLSEICVRKGEFVRQGHMIGRVGKTGNANSRYMQPHLHLEVRYNGIPQDPLNYLQ
ncbi:MAG: M23 family metallopeptidase [Candidatus Omnitrophota bacterium]